MDNVKIAVKSKPILNCYVKGVLLVVFLVVLIYNGFYISPYVTRNNIRSVNISVSTTPHVKNLPHTYEKTNITLKMVLKCINLLTKRDSSRRDIWKYDPGLFLEKCDDLFVYDLQVRPVVAENAQTNDEVFKDKINAFKKTLNITENDNKSSLLLQYYRLLNKMSRNINVRTFHKFYPQLIDLKEAIWNLTRGEPVSQYPMNDPHMILFRIPQNACKIDSDEELDLLILVKNTPTNSERRSKLRDYYKDIKDKNPKLNFKVVFNTALPYSESDNLAKLPYFDSLITGNAGENWKKFQKNGDQYTAQLFQESDKYKDILIGGFYDSYYNLTMKMFTGLRWTSVFCGDKVKMLHIVDDDSKSNVENIIRMQTPLTEWQIRQFSAGFMWNQSQVTRPSSTAWNNRWALDENEYPWPHYHFYYGGYAMFIGSSIFKKLAIGGIFVKENRIEDANLGLVESKLDISRRQLVGLTVEHSSTVKFKDYLVAGL